VAIQAFLKNQQVPQKVPLTFHPIGSILFGVNTAEKSALMKFT
jgi:hypothetical protein